MPDRDAPHGHTLNAAQAARGDLPMPTKRIPIDIIEIRRLTWGRRLAISGGLMLGQA